MSYPEFILHNQNSNSANIILHGGSKGIESDFIQKIFSRSVEKGFTTLAFNFPYLDRGEDTSSGEQLQEEVEALESMVNLVKQLGYKQVNLIGKSLGGIVASYYLQNQDPDITFNLGILGLVLGDVTLEKFTGKLIVVQGENDRFGNIDAVKQNLQAQGITDAKLINIPNADHSYRDESKEPKYEDEAIEALFLAMG